MEEAKKMVLEKAEECANFWTAEWRKYKSSIRNDEEKTLYEFLNNVLNSCKSLLRKDVFFQQTFGKDEIKKIKEKMEDLVRNRKKKMEIEFERTLLVVLSAWLKGNFRDINPESISKNVLISFVEDLKTQGCLEKEFYKKKNLFAPDGLTAKLSKVFKDLNSSQLRKIFESFRELKSISEALEKKGLSKKSKFQKFEEALEKLYRIYPLLAYAKGRKLIPPEFYDILISLLEGLEKPLREKERWECVEEEIEKKLKGLVEFIHSFLAYHKFYHGNK
jgi:CRISPR-associated protein Csm2